MEKLWLLVVCLGLVEANTIPVYQHGHQPSYQYVDIQPANNHIDLKRMSDLVRILDKRTYSLQKLPELVSVLEKSTKSLARMPDLGKSLERISDLERVLKDMSESFKVRDLQGSIESLELKVKNLQLKFDILEKNLEDSQFTSRGASVCTGETMKTPEDWVAALNNVMNGRDVQDVCADADLLIRVVQSLKIKDGIEQDPPAGINPFGNYMTWVAGSDSLDKYFQKAKGIMNQREGGTITQKREKLLSYIQTWVGYDEDSIGFDDKFKYYLYVISKKASNAVSDYDYEIFSPTWDNLFKELSSFTFCNFDDDNNERCQRDAKIEINFSQEVKNNLKTQTASQVTGCKKAFWTCGSGDDGECSRDFCDMRKALIAERNKGGQEAVFKYYMKNQALRSAAEARAFFEIGVGATWLFTGDGSAYNGIFKIKTGAEYISRGDIPITKENPQGEIFQILPVP